MTTQRWALTPEALISSTVTPPLVGDYSGNNSVGHEDYVAWKLHFGSTNNLTSDGNGNGIVDAGDYSVWRDRFEANAAAGGIVQSAAIPEPTSVLLAASAVALTQFIGGRAGGQFRSRN